jgi:hypothetical protein
MTYETLIFGIENGSDPERVDSLIEEGSDLRVRAHAGDSPPE